MTRRPDLPDELDRAGFSTRAAGDRGVSSSRLRAADLDAPFRGIRTAGPAASIPELARAFAARMPPGGRFTHTTAAVLQGLRMPEGFRDSGLHVAVPRPRRAPRVRGVVGHQVCPDEPCIVVAGLPVATPVDTWLQCAAVLPVHDVVVMGDGLLSRFRPPASLDELMCAVDARPGQRGSAVARAALPQLRAGTDSARETMLRLLIVRAGLPEPEVNGAIANRFGAIIAHGDLVYREQRVVIEYEGEGHLTARQLAVDIRRLDELMEEGWRVIRVDKHLMLTRSALLAKIARALGR